MLVTVEMFQKAAAITPAELTAILKAGDLPVGDADEIKEVEFAGMRNDGLMTYIVTYNDGGEEGTCQVFAKWKRRPFEQNLELYGVF